LLLTINTTYHLKKTYYKQRNIIDLRIRIVIYQEIEDYLTNDSVPLCKFQQGFRIWPFCISK